MNNETILDKSEPIFVTGATGFIGSKLVEQLLADGYRVRGMSRNKPTLPPGRENDAAALWNHPHFEFVAGNVTDPESLRKAMDGCPWVIHLAGYAKNYSPDPTTFVRINKEGMENVFDAAKSLGVRKIVWTSSIVTLGPTAPGVVADEETPRITDKFMTEYEESKSLAEREAKRRFAEEGLPVVIVNPTRVYGPGPLSEGNSLGRLLDDYDRGRFPFLLNFGKNYGNYGFVDDVARGHFLALRYGRPGQRYILGGENATLKEFFDLVSKVTEKKHFMIPLWLFWPLVVANLLLLRAKLFGAYPAITPSWVRSFAVDARFDVAKSVRELGYSVTPLEEGLRQTCDWLHRIKEKGKK